MAGWVLKVRIRLSQLSTKMQLKLKLSLAKTDIVEKLQVFHLQNKVFTEVPFYSLHNCKLWISFALSLSDYVSFNSIVYLLKNNIEHAFYCPLLIQDLP